MVIVRVISPKKFREFWGAGNAAAEQPLKALLSVCERAEWKSAQDIKAEYPKASIVGNRIVFDVKGNTLRVVVHCHYNTGKMFIRWVGTHADYDKIDVANI